MVNLNREAIDMLVDRIEALSQHQATCIEALVVFRNHPCTETADALDIEVNQLRDLIKETKAATLKALSEAKGIS